MLGIQEKYNTFRENTHFSKLKAGGRFAIYALGIYLAAKVTIGCLGLIMGSFLLTLPLAMLIFHPLAWILMGIVLAATYKMVVEPLFHLVKGYVDEKGTVKGEKSPKEQKFIRSKSLDSGLDTISRKTEDYSDKRVRRNSYSPSTDSVIVPGSEPASSNNSRRNSNASGDSGLAGKEFYENLNTLVHQTNRKNYAYWLQQHDIAHIARIKYKYSEDFTYGVFFCIPGNLESLSERLREYKNKAERESSKRIFTSVINLGGNHWVTLVVAYSLDNKQFRAYYCDSFSADLPSSGSQSKKIELANEIKELVTPLTDQASELNAQGKKEMSKDVKETAQTCRNKKDELVNVPINTDNIVSALEKILKIGKDNIRSSKTKQQNDGFNCGIFALENAHKITQMLNEGKLFDEIDKELSEYKFDLNGKRREFAKALMEDEKWKEDLGNGLLCNLLPRTETFSTSQHTGSFCNIT